jgi:hypothetical protein
VSYPRHGWQKDQIFNSGASTLSVSPLPTQNELTRQVEPADLEKFHSEYGTLLKAGMSTLRKRDKKREKSRAEELAKKKKRLMEAVVVSGPKRGAGRNKRKRLITAAVRLAEFKKRAVGKGAVKTGSS